MLEGENLNTYKINPLKQSNSNLNCKCERNNTDVDNNQLSTNSSTHTSTISNKFPTPLLTKMNMDDTIKICTVILEQIAGINEPILRKKLIPETHFKIFDSEFLSNRISLYDYIERISNYLEIEKSILVLSMMILDKLLSENSELVFTRLNYHK